MWEKLWWYIVYRYFAHVLLTYETMFNFNPIKANSMLVDTEKIFCYVDHINRIEDGYLVNYMKIY